MGFEGGIFVEEPGSWGEELWAGIEPVLLAILSIVGAVAVGYAVFLGASLAKAEDESKRKQAKSRIIKTLAGLFIIVILSSTMIIPGPDGSTLLTTILTGTTDRVLYRFESVNFEMGKPMQIVLYRNGVPVTGGIPASLQSSTRNTGNVLFNSSEGSSEDERLAGLVTFRVIEPGDAGISIDSAGRITATGPGSGVIEISFNGKPIFEQFIIIRPEGELPPPPPRPIDTPPPPPPPPPTQPPPITYPPGVTNPGVSVPPSYVPPTRTGKALTDFINLAVSYAGKAGYSQVVSTGNITSTPTRNTVSHNSYHYVNGTKTYVNIRYFDCSSFTTFLYASVGVDAGGNSSGQRSTWTKAARKVAVPQPGDLFWRPGHVGIYLGQYGQAREFGSFGKVVSGPHMIIHCSGGQGKAGEGYYWSNFKGNTYRKGVCFGTIEQKDWGKHEFFRPYSFPS